MSDGLMLADYLTEYIPIVNNFTKTFSSPLSFLQIASECIIELFLKITKTFSSPLSFLQIASECIIELFLKM
jgi:hypothetical protein